jgi:hypothetical protein
LTLLTSARIRPPQKSGRTVRRIGKLKVGSLQVDGFCRRTRVSAALRHPADPRTRPRSRSPVKSSRSDVRRRLQRRLCRAAGAVVPRRLFSPGCESRAPGPIPAHMGAARPERCAGRAVIAPDVREYAFARSYGGECTQVHSPRPRAQPMCNPPLHEKSAPVVNPASSVDSQVQIEPISSALPSRLTGIVWMIFSRTSSRTAITMSVAM